MDFQGFQHTLPGIIVVLGIILLAIVAWLSYRNRKTIPPLPRIGLIGLRFSAFLIIFLLFLNPYFFSSETVEKNPRILFLLDNSESVAISKGDYQGEETYRDVIDKLNLSEKTDLDLEFFTIGSESRQLSTPDSLSFSASETNFTNAVSQVQELEDDFDAVAVISDGIITFGRNPIIQASNLSIPIYTIAVGDTAVVRDVTINNVVYNPTGYTNTRHIVDVEIAQNGYANSSAAVSVLNSQGEVIEQTETTFDTKEQVKSLQFEIPLEEAGLKQFSVQVASLPDEWSVENNRTNFSVDVSESKNKILHVAFEIHPDVKLLRTILAEDQNIELSTLTWIGGDRFTEDTRPDLEETDLLILHGVPGTSFNADIFAGYETLPSVYFQLPRSRRNTENFSELQLLENSGAQLFRISLVPNAAGNDHPIMDLPEVGYDNLAPLISSLRTNVQVVDAVPLFNSVFQGIENSNPVVAVMERGGIRRAHIAPWGWYKMNQSTRETEREFITQLFSNIAIWASNDPDDRRLKIFPSKPVFNISEDVIINANLNNESGEPESEAMIEVTLTSEDETERSFNMRNEGSGVYKLEMSSLRSGLYSYTATARKGDREIDTQTGEFLVEDSNTELVNTIRNDDLLTSLAFETGGRFFTFENVADFWTSLDRDQILEEKQETVESYIFPIRNLLWFVIVLLLLGSEWLIRKYYSLP